MLNVKGQNERALVFCAADVGYELLPTDIRCLPPATFAVMKWLLLVLGLACACCSRAQLYAIPDTNIEITKTTDFTTLHYYAEVENLTNDTLAMKWRCRFEPGFPSQWDVSFDDQTTYFQQLVPGDSSVVVLDTGLAFPRKFIIGVQHNGQVGYGVMTVTLFPLRSPADSMRIHYIVTVTPGTGTRVVEWNETAMIVDDLLILMTDDVPATALVWDIRGRSIAQVAVRQQTTIAPAAHWPKGILWLAVMSSRGSRIVELYHF